MTTFVVVGAGQAGATAAATLRAQGFDGDVVLIGSEPELPYERPPLSKEFLRGDRPFSGFLVRPEDFWDEHHVQHLAGVTATQVDTARRTVALDVGGTLTYDKLLVATGLRNRALTVPGSGLKGVHSLRTLAEARALRAAAAGSHRAVVVGMGFVGAEVAATLRAMGVEVEVVEPLPGPVHRALGGRLGSLLADVHREHGVRMHFGEGVDAFAGTRRVEAVLTLSARAIPCDLVVVGIGTLPSTDLLDGSDVRTGNGILVDEHCQTSAPGVYAAGDVANHFLPHLGRHVRVEHFQHATRHGAAAAANMLGDETPYDEVHWFWSDQYDLNIQALGDPAASEDLVIRGDPAARRFVAYALRDDRIEGAVAFNAPRDLRRAAPLVRAQTPVDRRKLADPDVDIRSVAQTGDPA